MNHEDTVLPSIYGASLEQFLLKHSNQSVLKLFDIQLKNAIEIRPGGMYSTIQNHYSGRQKLEEA